MIRLLRALLVAASLTAAAPAGTVSAVAEVEIEGTVVSIAGAILTIDADGARVPLDASEIDSRYVESLVPGDQVLLAAFRLADGSLLVYSIFVQAQAIPPSPRPRPAEEPEAP